MELKDIEYPLPPPLAELLEAMVDVAEKEQVLTVTCITLSGEYVQTYTYQIDGGGTYNKKVPNLKGRPLFSLWMLGLIEQDENSVLLYPLAFERVKYERKSWLGKWWVRVNLRAHNVVLTVVTVVTIILAILQIVDLLK